MKLPDRSALTVFWIVFGIGLAWSIYTQHAWEDYYITYRASKNLATGNGLVFTPGEKVHSFTSPLGVLLPAVASLLTLNSSDAAALWIFRLMSIAALAGAGVLLWKTARNLHPGILPALFIVGLFATDNKIVDNSINGMETGILMLFLAWTLWALFTRPPGQRVHLGLAWAGLMWTRPDSFIYIGALGLAALLFRPSGHDRRSLLRTFFASGAITTVCYLPWLVWAWWYYGSPVPHTVKAKGLFAQNSPAQLWERLVAFPSQVVSGETTLSSTFLPAYGFATGWPQAASTASFFVSLLMAIVWLLPRVRWEARVTSFAFLAGHLYLSVMVGFPVPWYLPMITALGVVALGLVFAQWLGAANGGSPEAVLPRRPWVVRVPLIGAAGILVLAGATLSVFAAFNLRMQQSIIETGNRQVIGEWLRDNAKTSQDSVFLEPLGYIGFFSGLKMLDYPGLSSPEVVAARRRASSRSYPACWPELIHALKPDWLVLRPYEIKEMVLADGILLQESYEKVRVFDVSAEVAAIAFLPGRGYLDNDAVFEVYRRRPPPLPEWASEPGVMLVTLATVTRSEAIGEVTMAHGTIGAHAPSVLAHPVPPNASRVRGQYGIFPRAFENPEAATDGAEFRIEWVSSEGVRTVLHQRLLRPVITEADRRSASFDVALPPGASGTIEFIATPGPDDNTAFDWTYWTDLRFNRFSAPENP